MNTHEYNPYICDEKEYDLYIGDVKASSEGRCLELLQ